MFVRTRKWKWIRRVGITSLVVIGLYALLGFLLVPHLIRKNVTEMLSETLGTEVTLAECAFNPFTLRLRVNDFVVRDDLGEALVFLPEVRVDVSWKTLFTFTPHLNLVELDTPRLAVVRLEEGGFSFDQIVSHVAANTTEEGEESAPPRLYMSGLSIIDGAIVYEDRAVEGDFYTEISPLNLDLTGFSTERDHNNAMSFVADSAKGGQLVINGHFSLMPLRAQGRLTLRSEMLADYSAYARPFTPLKIESADLSVNLAFDFDPVGNPEILTVSQGDLSFGEVTFVDEERGLLPVSVGSFEIEGALLNLRSGLLSIEQVSLEGGELMAVRESDDRLNFQRYFRSTENEGEGVVPAEADETTGFAVQIAEVKARDVQFKWVDETLPDAPEWMVALQTLDVEGFALSGEEPIIVGMSMVMADGSLSVLGEVRLTPFVAELDFRAVDLPLHQVSPYILPIYPIVPESALADFTAALKIAGTSREATGEARLHGLVTVDTRDGTNPASWQELRLQGFQVIDDGGDLVRVHVETVDISSPRLLLVFTPDGELNLMPLEGAEPSGEEVKSTSGGVAFTYGRLNLSDGEVIIRNEALSPALELKLERVRAELEQLPSVTAFRILASEKMGGTVDIKGRVNLDDPASFLRADVDINALNIRPFSGYTIPFVGRPVRQGNLSLAMRYEVTERALTGQNDIRLGRFYLGDRVTGVEPQIKAPVGLALDILRDRSDMIAVGIPVSGNIDDPSFSLRGVIIQGIVQLFGRVATAPFSLLASIVSTNEDLSRITFEPGSIELTAANRERLDLLGKALAERPALQVTITPGIDEEGDTAGLRRIMLEGELRQLVATLPTPPPSREGLIALLYEQRREVLTRAGTAPATVEEGEDIVPSITVSPETDAEVTNEGRTIVRRPTRGTASSRAVFVPSGGTVSPEEPSAEVDEVSVEQVVRETEVEAVRLGVAEMEAALLGATILPDSALAILASERARRVRDYLLNTAGVDQQRMRVESGTLATGAVVELGL